jgi:hypothetical protein
MNFWSGQAVLRRSHEQTPACIRIFMDDDFDVKIEMPNVFGFRAIMLGQEDDLEFAIPECDPIRVYLSHTVVDSGEDSKLIFTPQRMPIWRSSGGRLARGRAALINFAGFDARFSSSRFEMNCSGWQVTVIALSDKTLRYPVLQVDQPSSSSGSRVWRVNGGPHF